MPFFIKETVLVADDDGFVRRVYARILERAGYIVLEARDGREALDLICSYQGTIDLLFTDVIMPHLDGRQLADVATALRPELKVLFTSAFTTRMVVVQGVLNPGLSFIDKSAHPDQVLSKVRETLSAPRLPQAPLKTA